MYVDYWWTWGIVGIILDILNPYVSLYGAVPEVISLVLLWFMLVLVKTFRRHSKIRRTLQSFCWTCTALILQIGLTIKLTFFVLTSDLITGVCRPSGFILWTVKLSIPTSTVFFAESCVLHMMMCLMVWKKIEKNGR